MSNEQDKNKVTIDDEKFINELYAELNSELKNSSDDNSFNEQPSESLDQSILAVAHKAVGSCPKVVEESIDKSPRAKKSRAWHVPLSLAASTVLVVSLVVNQGEKSILPNEPSMSEPVAAQADMQYERAVNTKGQATSEIKIMAQSKKRELAKQRTRQDEKMGSAAAQLAKIKPVQAKVKTQIYTELLSAEENVMADSMLAQAEHTQPAMNESVASLNEQLPASKRAENIVIPLLSYQQYLLFKEQDNQWSLLKETEDSYLISVYIKSHVNQYKLLKKDFNINGLLSDVETKFLFEQITLLNKK